MAKNGRVTTRELHQVQLDTHDRIATSERRVMGAISDLGKNIDGKLAALATKEEVDKNAAAIKDLRDSDTKIKYVTILAGAITGFISGIFGGNQ